MFEALSNRDSAALKSCWTSNATLYEYGQVWNLDTLIRRAITTNKSTNFKRTNAFEFLSTTQDKNTAWATYRLTSTIIRDGKQTALLWLESVMLVRNKKEWKLKHLHSTLVKREIN